MNSNYAHLQEKGAEFQDFVVDLFLREMGIALSVYSSRRNQYERGETAQGVEIKYDAQFERTGNLYIEVAEKTDAALPSWTPSGIYRKDNTWLYAIGDYTTVFLFDKKQLQRIHAKGGVREVEIPTSRGFLLEERFHEYAIKILHGKEATNGQA